MGIRSKTIISTVSRTKQRINREKHINHTEREGPRIEDGTKRETTDHWSGRKKQEWEKHLERLHALLGAKDLMLDQKKQQENQTIGDCEATNATFSTLEARTEQ